jgi:hypothetical protein
MVGDACFAGGANPNALVDAVLPELHAFTITSWEIHGNSVQQAVAVVKRFYVYCADSLLV